VIYAGPKAFFFALSRSPRIKRLASRYGMAGRRGFARRFIAGETIDEAIECGHRLHAQGLLLTLDYLGESVQTMEAAVAAAREYVQLIEAIVESGIERNISLKLTQLGLDVDRATCVDNLRRILEPAGQHGFFVRIDMENSPYTDATLDVVETLWQLGYRGIGVALQAALHRTGRDVARMNTLGVRVRLVKGAYKEPASVAHQRKAAVDAAFFRLAQQLIAEGPYPAMATHDEALIEQVREWATRQGVPPTAYEFQMLYGIRRDLQASLVRDGHPVRVYVPFGREWFPYFMRRLGERPANVAFVLRALVSERHPGIRP
jgi:proline dehydrogenase